MPFRISASRTISCTPPARQASLRRPDGTLGASAQTASIQSRRAAGTIRSAPRRTAPPGRPSPLTAPLASAHPAWPAAPAVPAGLPAQPHQRAPQRRVRQRSAGTGAAEAGPAQARPASTPPPAPGQPAGSRSGTGCPTSGPPAWPAHSHAATQTAGHTAPPVPTASAPRTRSVLPQQKLYIGRPGVSASSPKYVETSAMPLRGRFPSQESGPRTGGQAVQRMGTDVVIRIAPAVSARSAAR
jgi:hypothetical protein